MKKYREVIILKILLVGFFGVVSGTVLAQTSTKTVLWYGESTARGTGVREESPENAFMWIVSDRLQKWKKHDVTYSFENLGFPGWNSKMANSEKFDKVLNKNFDYIFLEFALNDTELTTQEIEEALSNMVMSFKSKNEKVKIILILLNKLNQIEFRINNSKLDETSKAWLDFANKHDLQVIDVANKMMMKTTYSNFFKSIIPDGVHPNEMGHYLYANLIYEDLISNKIFN